jgi:hypothetical protein
VIVARLNAGKATRKAMWSTALSPAKPIPSNRAQPHPRMSPDPTARWSRPTISRNQPQAV